MDREQGLDSAEIARKVVDAASEKQAADIVMMDVRAVCGFADYFVITSAESDRQLQAVLEEITRALRESGAKLFSREGTVDSGWVLLDFGDVIVHVFSPEKRAFYQLEQLWSRAVPVLRVQ